MTKSIDETISHEAKHTEVVLEATSVSKSYGPVQALSEMSLSVQSGEIRALVGENGSGKSTFVGIVSGTVESDTGTVSIADVELRRNLPIESQNAGALTVFQDGSLLPTLTVAENLYIGTPTGQRPKYGEIFGWARARLRDFSLELNPLFRVAQLAPGDRQLLEIVRAVMARPRLLLLDEATSALDASGVDRVLELMRLVARQGTGVLFVTHRLAEVFRVADSVTILRDGHFVDTAPISRTSTTQIVELMAGTKVDMEFPVRNELDDSSEEILSADRLSGDQIESVDLKLRAGQIVGIAGADGNGQAQLLRGLAGLGGSGGTVTIEGKVIKNYRQATKNGIVFLSGDRRHESLFQALNIRENLSSGVLGKLAVGGVVSGRAENRFVSDQLNKFGIRLGSPSHLPGSLSGGNQQKIAISKAIATKPRVFLIDEPTQGVDVRSRMDIYRMLRATADAGNAVVVVSSDASELAGIADRIVVMSRGHIIEEMPGRGSNEESIVGAFAVGSRVADDVRSPSTETMRLEIAGKSKLPRWLRGGEAVRLGVLSLIIVLLGAFAASQNPTFLSPLSLRNVLIIATPLAAVAIAQYFVLLVGGIDVSVGATMSLSVVAMSFVVQSGGFIQSFTTAMAVAILLGALVGVINAWLVEKMKVSAVIATIATLGIVSGVALALRPRPGGAIDSELMVALTQSLGFLPAPFIVLIAVVIVGDVVLRWTGLGMRVRAVGLNGLYANRLGIRATRVRVLCYTLCGMLAAIAGVLLAVQVGIGDASVGETYTLLAIAAPVLGGASLLGGRGTLMGVLLGSVLLGLAMTLSVVLRISQGANLMFIGIVTIIALAAYAVRFRRKAT
ncbi:ATP-binding cassette domain-containing protein [Microbacterium sp. LRZ72]|uniref:ATP-binding cassette domain-containing protein n=1 Tax=Microbacterium sp. LRZ72 TaxID=2942481 RepID=UPI0029BE95EE|nr:ATP-binding cassette domain-containing protein [Microbacterium sp. LRZ72]MDX2378091.1 ATP-binding cassette domain-containing protein [Microbacterium sp. LRZ72]